MPLLMCPNDNAAMQTLERNGVQFDMCPECRGVWLDRGELEKLMESATDEGRAAAPAAGPSECARARSAARRPVADSRVELSPAARGRVEPRRAAAGRDAARALLRPAGRESRVIPTTFDRVVPARAPCGARAEGHFLPKRGKADAPA